MGEQIAATVAGGDADWLELVTDHGVRRRIPRSALDSSLREVRRGQRLQLVVEQQQVVGARLAGAPLVVSHLRPVTG